MQEIDLIIDGLNKSIAPVNNPQKYYLDKFSHLEYMLNKKCTDLFEPKRKCSPEPISFSSDLSGFSESSQRKDEISESSQKKDNFSDSD
jgi:hypothetical protein